MIATLKIMMGNLIALTSIISCNNKCAVETGYYCIYATNSVCRERCGDGKNINNVHPCDDGNNLSYDGCSSTCQLEAGFTCKGYGPNSCTEDCDGTWKGFLLCDGGGCCNAACTAIVTGTTFSKTAGCKEICGSGLSLGITPKACEDGSARADDEYYGDGCDWKCTVEAGFTCPAVGKCTETCGAKTYDSYNYPCDDGNNVSGDGCSSTCAIEYGY